MQSTKLGFSVLCLASAIMCGAAHATVVTVEFAGILYTKTGPHADELLIGELVTGSYSLETAVNDLVPANPNEGRYRNSVVSATVHFHGSGLTFTHGWGPGLFNDVSVFNDLTFSNGRMSDQVGIAAWSRTGGSLLGGEAPTLMDINFSVETQPGVVPQMVLNDAVPTHRLSYINANVSLRTSAGWTQTLLLPIPEPSTYVLMLAGLGFVAYATNRRKRA